jgi:predicted transposase/invertase (TIGR01784 family)
LLSADKYNPEELRTLLPGVEFDQAITVIERISKKTEDRMMYNQREKAQRDHQWVVEGAREEGREEARGTLVDTVTLLQGIADEAETDIDELNKLDIDKLKHMCADLRERLRTRGC